MRIQTGKLAQTAAWTLHHRQRDDRAPEIRIEEAVRAGLALERAVGSVPEVERVVSRIGSPAVATDIMGLEQADIFVRLSAKDRWQPHRTGADVIADIERAARKVDPEVELAFTQPIQMRFNELLGGAVADVSISVFGEDLAELHRIANQVRARIAQIPGAQDVRVLAPPNVPLLEIVPDVATAAALELAPRDVLDSVAALRAGLPAATTFDGPLRVPIVLRTPGVDSPAAIGGALVSNSRSGLVPLASIARHTSEAGKSALSQFVVAEAVGGTHTDLYAGPARVAFRTGAGSFYAAGEGIEAHPASRTDRPLV